MGTHPIFESDFDCLTEKMSYPVDEKPPPPYAQNPPMAGFEQAGMASAPVTNQQPLPGQPPVVQVVHTQQVIAQPHRFGRDPLPTVCPHCNQSVTTKVEYKNGLATWLICGGCAIFGCWLGCCLIPFCVNDMKDVVHECPRCGKVISTKAVLS